MNAATAEITSQDIRDKVESGELVRLFLHNVVALKTSFFSEENPDKAKNILLWDDPKYLKNFLEDTENDLLDEFYIEMRNIHQGDAWVASRAGHTTELVNHVTKPSDIKKCFIHWGIVDPESWMVYGGDEYFVIKAKNYNSIYVTVVFEPAVS